jgi:hypothetical protein
MPVSYAFNASAEEAAAKNYPLMRYIYVSANSTPAPLPEFFAVSPWALPLTGATAGSFSAICFYTARSLVDGLRAAGAGDVPVGMIHSALGGTALQQWMSPEAAAACPRPTTGPNYSYSGLYNAMISPMINRLVISAVVLYQGVGLCAARAAPRPRAQRRP